jgi:glycosyltransferase involved in cell wall biosynthesis
MTSPIRLTAVLTHPIQYYAPWFRHIETHAPEIALTVVHATQPTPDQQGVGFDRAFEWDVPLTDGYRAITVRAAQPTDRVDSSHFTGLDVPEIGRAIEDTHPDVVMIAGWYSVTLIRAMLACRRLGVPTLNRGDSHLLSGPVNWKRVLWVLKTRLLLRQFDGFLCPGRRVREYLRWYGVPDHRIFHVPHAVDNEMFAATALPFQQPDARAAARRRLGVAADAFVPLFVGKLVSSKRPTNIVRAAARLGGGVSVVFVGSGALDAELRTVAAELGVDLRLVGFMNQTELGEAYALADCLVLPSDYSETWGLVVNEALATGLPCVVSHAVGCAPDMIREGESGYIYPLGNVAELAAALEKVRQRKADGYDWRRGCREVVAEFSYGMMTAGLVRACRSVIRHSIGAEPDWNEAPRRIIACCGQMVIAGGLERMTFEVLRVLKEQGVPAHSIVNSWENFRITPLVEASGSSWSVGPYWYPLTRRALSPGNVFRMLLEVLSVSTNLLRVSWRVRPTHVFLPDFHTALRNSLALLWLRARGVRVVARLGNAPATGRFYRFLWLHVINRLVDRFVANSSFTQRELLAHGIPPAKVETITNMPSRRARAWGSDGIRIPGRVIFVGQIIPEKGVDLLLDALAIVRARGVEATLDIVGDMDGWEAPGYRGHRASLRERAGRPDLSGAVAFLGWREDVPLLLSRASLHCCPSRPEQREAFGNVVLEAKLSGVPSIVTPSGDLPELVAHGSEGWVCREASAVAIAEALEFFLTRPAALEAAREAAFSSADRYTEDRFAAAWVRIFTATTHEPAHAIQ